MAALNLKAFGKCLLQSKLVDREALEVHAKQCQQSLGSLSSKKLAQHLVSQKVLTAYQAKRLLQGRSEGFFLGGCRILDRLGEGGMGVVYLAQQERLDRKVAVKVLPAAQTVDTDALKRFYREAKAAAKLKHANIVQVFDVDQQDGTHFIVMELVNGKNLSELLKRDGVIPVGEALSLIRQAAEGLQHAHANGVIHRDIKPANLVVEDSTLKILDLGLARHEGDERMTGDQTIMGTLDYMSPEQCQDTAGVDHRSDIYSLGCTLYHLLVGNAPFSNRPQTGKLLAHVTEPLPDVHLQNAAIPESVNQLLQRMTAKQRDDRVQSAAELITDIDALNDESQQQTFIAPAPMLADDSAMDAVAASVELPESIPSFSDEDTANSNTVIHSPQSSGWNLALLIPVMAALVLAGVYMGIQLLKDKRGNETVGAGPDAIPAAQDQTETGTGIATSVDAVPSNERSEARPEGLETAVVEPHEQVTLPAKDDDNEETPSPTDTDVAAAQTVSTEKDTPPLAPAMAATDSQSNDVMPNQPPPAEVAVTELLPQTREPHETVLRSFENDWQADLVDGDILTLISPETYELKTQIDQVKDFTIQGTEDKRAVMYLSTDSNGCWKLSDCKLTLQHLDIYVTLPRETGTYDVFTLDTADLTLSDVSITIMEGGRQTWEDISIVRVSGAREWDVLAKGDAPEPLSVQLRRLFVRGPGALVRNSSSHSVISMQDSLLTGTGPLLHAFHTTERAEKHQAMELQVESSTVVTQQPVVSIDCRPFELRPVPMRVAFESSIIASQMPALSPPNVVHWLSPIKTSRIADAFGFVGAFNLYVGRGPLFIAEQANGTSQTVCQFPQDWERQKLGQDSSRNTSPPRRSSKRIVWQDQVPRDFQPASLALNASDLKGTGAPTRELEVPKRLRLSGN